MNVASFFPRRLNFAWALLVFLLLIGNAQADSAQEAIVVKDIQLTSIEYPWGRELGIHFKGQAQAFLDNSVLTISVFYLNKRAYMFNHIVCAKTSIHNKKRRKKILIDENWGPLNAAGQEILPGKYYVKIELDLQQQIPELQEKWQKKYGDRAKWVQYKKYQIYKAAFDEIRYSEQGKDSLYKKAYDRKYQDDTDRISRELRMFYVDRMRNLNELYREIQVKKKLALRSRNNPFLKDGKFDEKKWRNWFKKDYIKRLGDERTILERHKKKVFAPRYPMTLNNMLKYASIIERMANFMALEVYRHYRLRNGERLYQVDPQAIKNRRDITRLIQRLHSTSSIELKISLRKELGYLPPPIID